MSREESDWVEGRHLVSQGEAIDVLRFNGADEDGFAWVRSRSEPQKQGDVDDNENHFFNADMSQVYIH